MPFDLSVIHIPKSDCMKREILLPKGKRTYQYILSAMVTAQYSPQQMPAFSAEQKKHTRLEQRYKSSPRDPENSFPYQANGRFPDSQCPAMSPSQLLSGCVSAWHRHSAYSDGIAQASHLFPFYPLAKHDRLAEAPAASCYSITNTL